MHSRLKDEPETTSGSFYVRNECCIFVPCESKSAIQHIWFTRKVGKGYSTMLEMTITPKFEASNYRSRCFSSILQVSAKVCVNQALSWTGCFDKVPKLCIDWLDPTVHFVLCTKHQSVRSVRNQWEVLFWFTWTLFSLNASSKRDYVLKRWFSAWLNQGVFCSPCNQFILRI